MPSTVLLGQPFVVAEGFAVPVDKQKVLEIVVAEILTVAVYTLVLGQIVAVVKEKYDLLAVVQIQIVAVLIQLVLADIRSSPHLRFFPVAPYQLHSQPHHKKLRNPIHPPKWFLA